MSPSALNVTVLVDVGMSLQDLEVPVTVLLCALLSVGLRMWHLAQ